MVRGKSERYEIRHERTDAHDHFYCADYQWDVIDLRTGKSVATFTESMEGAQFIGVKDIVLSQDGLGIIVTYHDGAIEHQPLS
jgi:hypothetical protein